MLGCSIFSELSLYPGRVARDESMGDKYYRSCCRSATNRLMIDERHTMNGEQAIQLSRTPGCGNHTLVV